MWIRSRARRPLVALVAGALGAVGLAWLPAGASEPESTDVKITTQPGSTTYTWTGEVGPAPTGLVGAATDPCTQDGDLEDVHTIKLDLAARVYKSVVAEFTFQIAWDNASDLALLVAGEQGTVGTSDGGEPIETVAAINLDEGEYVVNPCAFYAAGPTEYRGSLKVVIKEKRKPKAAAATPPPESTGSSVAPRPSSGSSSSNSPLPASPSRPSSGSRSSAPAATPQTGPSSLPPVEAAPPAFISSGVDPVESAAPPPVQTVAKETRSMPLGVALLVSALGLGGLAAALLVRRRRGLDQAPGTAVVPVTS